MSGQEILSNLAFIVSICVVIGIALTFSILFSIYGFYKIKHISYGHEDKKLEEYLRIKYREIIKRRSDELLNVKDVEHYKKVEEPDYVLVQNLKNVKTFTLVGEKEVEIPQKPTTVIEAIFETKKKQKKRVIISNTLFCIFYAIILIMLGVSIGFRLNGQQLFFGNTTLVAIYTGSMETANITNNTYLEENGLLGPENRIIQYSLIGLNKLNDPADMKLYDIYGFKNSEGTLIVHRLIRIYTNTSSGETYYTFRGDANSASLSYEITVKYDQIVGVYNGFQNTTLGITLIYLQSNIGLIAIISAFVFLATYQSTEHFIDLAYDKRSQAIAKQIDAKPYILEKKKQTEKV